MGASRALITHRWPSGATSYFNSEQAANKFIDAIGREAVQPSDINLRIRVVEEGLFIQDMFGVSTLADLIQKLRRLNKLVNRAKHELPMFDAEPPDDLGVGLCDLALEDLLLSPSETLQESAPLHDDDEGSLGTRFLGQELPILPGSSYGFNPDAPAFVPVGEHLSSQQFSWLTLGCHVLLTT